MKNTPVNQQIKTKSVRVIDGSENLGILDLKMALSTATQKGMDLVEISQGVCKIMDYGKFKYEQSKSKKQHQLKTHEIKFGVQIDNHDFEVKINHIKKFLTKGEPVVVYVTFKGRQNAHTEIGFQLVDRILTTLGDVNHTKPTKSGTSISFRVSP